MASHKFVEYSRIFRKHSIPLGLRPNTIISCHAVAHKVAEPLFAARSVDTMLNRRIRTPGYDGVKATDIRMIMRGTSSKDTTRNPLLPLSDDKGREELPVLPVPPFQDRPLRNFYDLVEGMQHALKKGKYEADVLMPRGWDLRWYRRQYDQLQKEKTRDSKDNNNTSIIQQHLLLNYTTLIIIQCQVMVYSPQVRIQTRMKNVPTWEHPQCTIDAWTKGTLLLCDVHVDSTTGRYHYYIPHSHATMLEDLIRKLHKLLLDTPHGDSGNDNKMMISQEAGYCARQILGRANLYLNIDSTIPCVSRISNLYSKGSLTKEGIINEVRSWNEVPDQL
ncbi:hypothetical protein BDF22DRAFT_698512 [Syncephalis plumigaleata]|nr:hypothetical protein BDF22DRAFT_698512 [Syncephalis plumigaleata]